jgi:DNA topoisomerase IA
MNMLSKIKNITDSKIVYKDFYTKLFAKLQKIKSGEMTLDEYIDEVKKKIEKL